MDISELQRIYAGHPNTKGLAALLEDSSVRTIFLGGLHASAAALFVSSFLRENKQTFVFVLGDLEEAGYFYHDLTQVNGDEHILFFPSSYRRAVKYGQKDAANEILRTEVLSRLQKGDPLCVVTYPEALAEKVVSQEVLMDKTLKLGVGEHVDTEFITEVLAGYGFEHVDYVYEPGQYAVRGSIIDVFSFASEYPYRIDFFGDEVDSIRTFEVENQLSKEKKQSIAIVPELTNAADKSGVSFFEFIPRETVLAMKDFLWVRERIQVVREEALSPQALAAYEGEKTELMNLELKLIDGAEFTVRALDFKRIEFGNKPTGTPQATLAFDTTVQPIFHKNFDLVSTSFTDYQKRGYTLYICTDSEKQAKRLKDIFEERGDHITFIPVNKTLHEGFTDNVLKSCFFTDHQIFDRFHKYNLRSDKARSGKVALTLKELSQFEPGDFVVHIDHGVGRFGGLVRIPNGNTTQEVIKLIYQNEDVVFVSIHSLHKISKYKGKEGETPRLNKLGTGAWEKMKERTKSKIKDIARDLIRLYSQRKQEKGFSYSPDSFMQHELEASFIYEDTPDQLKATQDAKADMESDRPMDRLVCGDVGFGKTEVAIRAAFKAVADNKQVAVLVPTTVLAYQHFQTFSERLKDFPCKVDYLSRARSAKDVSRIVKELADGKINILVGTHKIIGKSVKFKDLGLLIIDEEQKFGVSVKEKLRQMKVNVDTLTMTATPIPRTLQFSLMGARDLSVIQTPPPNRYPIQTEVHTFNEDITGGAVRYDGAAAGRQHRPAARASRTARTLCPGVCRSLLGALGCLGLLERPFALGDIQLFAGHIVVELLLAQGVLILPLRLLILVLLLGKAVLPLGLLHLLVPRSVSTLGRVGAVFGIHIIPGVGQRTHQRADAGGSGDGQLHRVADNAQNAQHIIERLLALGDGLLLLIGIVAVQGVQPAQIVLIAAIVLLVGSIVGAPAGCPPGQLGHCGRWAVRSGRWQIFPLPAVPVIQYFPAGPGQAAARGLWLQRVLPWAAVPAGRAECPAGPPVPCAARGRQTAGCWVH